VKLRRILSYFVDYILIGGLVMGSDCLAFDIRKLLTLTHNQLLAFLLRDGGTFLP